MDDWFIFDGTEIRPMTESEHARLVEAVRASDPEEQS